MTTAEWRNKRVNRRCKFCVNAKPVDSSRLGDLIWCKPKMLLKSFNVPRISARCMSGVLTKPLLNDIINMRATV